MMWNLFEISINALQAFLMIFFMKNKLPVRRSNRLWDIGFILIITVFLSLYAFVQVPFTDTFVFLFPLFYAFCSLGGKWYMKVMWSAALAAIFIAVTEASMNLNMYISGSSLSVVMAQTSNRVSCVIFCNVLLVVVVFVTSQSKQRIAHLSPASIMLFCLVELIHLVAIEELFVIRLNTDGLDVMFVMANLCLSLCAIGLMILFDMMNRLAEQRVQAMTEAESLRLTRKHQEEMKEMYQYLLSRQHDLGKQYQVVEQLLSEGHRPEGEAFLAELEKLPRIDAFMTGNQAVDALLTLKKLAMDKYSISFIFRPTPLQCLPIKEIDFCAVIANLLDNAIEANMGNTEQKQIILSFTQIWDMFFITCENTTKAPKEALSHKPARSTKQDYLGH